MRFNARALDSVAVTGALGLVMALQPWPAMLQARQAMWLDESTTSLMFPGCQGGIQSATA